MLSQFMVPTLSAGGGRDRIFLMTKRVHAWPGRFAFAEKAFYRAFFQHYKPLS
jgi:hypothetical protein